MHVPHIREEQFGKLLVLPGDAKLTFARCLHLYWASHKTAARFVEVEVRDQVNSTMAGGSL